MTFFALTTAELQQFNVSLGVDLAVVTTRARLQEQSVGSNVIPEMVVVGFFN